MTLSDAADEIEAAWYSSPKPRSERKADRAESKLRDDLRRLVEAMRDEGIGE